MEQSWISKATGTIKVAEHFILRENIGEIHRAQRYVCHLRLLIWTHFLDPNSAKFLALAWRKTIFLVARRYSEIVGLTGCSYQRVSPCIPRFMWLEKSNVQKVQQAKYWIKVLQRDLVFVHPISCLLSKIVKWIQGHACMYFKLK